MRPSSSGGDQTTSPSIAGAGTPIPGTATPTVLTTAAPTALVEVKLVSFGLLYVIDKDDIPPTEDYDAASAVTIRFINDYLASTYSEADASTYLGEDIVPGATAYSLISGAIRDYDGNTFFSNAGVIPLPSDLDAALEAAFSGDDVDALLELLATELPPENLFSSATNVRKVESSTMMQMSETMPARRQFTPTRFSIRKSLFAVAAVGMLGMLFYGGTLFFRGYRAQKRRLKGGFFAGDDILALGDNYYGGAYMTER